MRRRTYRYRRFDEGANTGKPAGESGPERVSREDALQFAAANMMQHFQDDLIPQASLDEIYAKAEEERAYPGDSKWQNMLDKLRTLRNESKRKPVWNEKDYSVMDEAHPQAREYIEDTLFADVGFNPKGGADATEHAWSAATVSKLASAFDPEFEGSARHSDYITRAFQGEGNYKPEPLDRKTEFKPGDILFKGRKVKDKETGEYKWAGPSTWKEFEAAAKGEVIGDWQFQDDGKGYGSHADIIVGTGTDENGLYYMVQGGNMSDRLMYKKYYPRQLSSTYAGRLTQ